MINFKVCWNSKKARWPSWTVVDDRLTRWQVAFEDLFALVAGHFAQADSPRRAQAYVLGLLSATERKNSWTLAEQAGQLTPDSMQRLLNLYRWDADAVRDDLRGYALDYLADPTGVAVADETGFLKKGATSAGVQRQYSGTAGRSENCQLDVFLTYASPQGRALIHRELYLPKSRTSDRDRCTESGTGDDVEFATKPLLAQQMLQRLVEAGTDIGWFTTDEAYGDHPGLRSWLAEVGLNYVMASLRHPLERAHRAHAGRRTRPTAPRTGGQRLSAGEGSTGKRLYDWLVLDPGSGEHLLLLRRSISTPSELAYYLCRTDKPVPVVELVRVAGCRWGVEETLCATGTLRRSTVSLPHGCRLGSLG